MKLASLSIYSLVATAAIALTPLPANALTIDFSFTYSGGPLDTPLTGPVTGTVTGQLVGLTDNATSAPTGVILDSFPAALGLSITAPYDMKAPGHFDGALEGTVTLVNGVVTDIQLLIVAGLPQIQLCLETIQAFCNPHHQSYSLGNASHIVYTDSIAFTEGDAPAATPLPAALPLFAGGLGAMGLLGWRRKRKASGAAAVAAA